MTINITVRLWNGFSLNQSQTKKTEVIQSECLNMKAIWVSRFCSFVRSNATTQAFYTSSYYKKIGLIWEGAVIKFQIFWLRIKILAPTRKIIETKWERNKTKETKNEKEKREILTMKNSSFLVAFFSHLKDVALEIKRKEEKTEKLCLRGFCLKLPTKSCSIKDMKSKQKKWKNKTTKK